MIPKQPLLAAWLFHQRSISVHQRSRLLTVSFEVEKTKVAGSYAYHRTSPVVGPERTCYVIKHEYYRGEIFAMVRGYPSALADRYELFARIVRSVERPTVCSLQRRS